MIRTTCMLIGLLLLAPAMASAAEDNSCVDCHKLKTPGVVAYWQQSAHYPKITCSQCHPGDAEANHKRTGIVKADTCGACHETALKEHRQSRHALGQKTGGGCTRNQPSTPELAQGCKLCHRPDTTEPITQVECGMFLAQSKEMQRIGCSSCHKVEASCDSCHTKHGTDLATAGAAETCGVCHMGPDHAQYEMWRSSIHGVLYSQKGDKAAPTCTTCHMGAAGHDVSASIATGKPAPEAQASRALMLNICSACHSPAFSSRNLADADKVFSQSLALLTEGQGIVQEMAKEGLLMPAPQERPGHPIFGANFVIGPLMTYDDLSAPEAKFFRMMMFYFMSTYKGAFHQNPDYAHWYGNAPLKLTLGELKSERELLRRIKRLEQRMDNLSSGAPAPTGDLKSKLRALKERKLKGELTEDEYTKMQRELLGAEGL